MIANLRKAAFDKSTAYIGGGEFDHNECAEAAKKLSEHALLREMVQHLVGELERANIQLDAMEMKNPTTPRSVKDAYQLLEATK